MVGSLSAIQPFSQPLTFNFPGHWAILGQFMNHTTGPLYLYVVNNVLFYMFAESHRYLYLIHLINLIYIFILLQTFYRIHIYRTNFMETTKTFWQKLMASTLLYHIQIFEEYR